MGKDAIKCRFCEWAIASFYRRKNGRLSTPNRGFLLLIRHYKENHPKEYHKICNNLGVPSLGIEDLKLEAHDKQKFNETLLERSANENLQKDLRLFFHNRGKYS